MEQKILQYESEFGKERNHAAKCVPMGLEADFILEWQSRARKRRHMVI